MRYVVVVASSEGGGCPNIEVHSFDDLEKAKEYADNRADEFDLDYKPGTVEAYQFNNDGKGEVVYTPEIFEYGLEADDEPQD